ncbi:DUF6232 family protein [Streptomyces sp. NPDC005925]|uniref:DUF6232 family protein n=1 Tax=Streptomyces sp. NPDC005925 TaxID=3157172 RepID=UPI003403C839
MPPQGAGSVAMRVTKRLLWVGGAAYPLSNVTRVYTFVLTPRRGAATALFFTRLAITLSVAFALTILGGVAAFAGAVAGDGEDATGFANDGADTAGTILTVVWIGALVGIVYALVKWVEVLSAPSHFALAVETSGASTALVTSNDTGHLQQLAGQVVHAIENPDVEFLVHVETLAINPEHYHFGDNVNMYGGSGNVGMSKG